MLGALRSGMTLLLQNHSSYPCNDAAFSTPRARMDAVIHEQEAAGVDVVTDGQIGWRDPVSRVMEQLDGVRFGDPVRYGATGHRFPQPIVTRALRRRAPVMCDDFAAARIAARLPVKPVLPGPYTLARHCVIESGAYRDVAALAHAFSEILTAEVCDLVVAGAQIIQIEEPSILTHPEDIRLLRQLLEPLWAARGSAELMLATYAGDAEPLYAQLNSVPADIVAFDFSQSPMLVEVIAATGASKVLALGVVNAGDPQLEEASVVARRVDRMLKHYALDTLYLLPSSGLGDLPPARARAKLELLSCIRRLVAPYA